jgi:hypothetical protein
MVQALPVEGFIAEGVNFSKLGFIFEMASAFFNFALYSYS